MRAPHRYFDLPPWFTYALIILWPVGAYISYATDGWPNVLFYVCMSAFWYAVGYIFRDD